jgi:hypothetical protein
MGYIMTKESRYCAGDAKNSHEKHVAASHREATTKACEQSNNDQLSQSWRHVSLARPKI